MLSFELFFRFLLSKRAGSLVKTIARISIVGIWLGVSALIIVVSVMNGFNRSIRDRLLQVEPHLSIEFDNEKSTDIVKHPVYEELKALDVKFMAPVSHQDVILRTAEGVVQQAIASGVTRDRLTQLFDYSNKRTGEKDLELKEKIQKLAAGEVILGVGLADSIGLFRDDTFVIIPPETLLLPAGEIPQLARASVKGFLLTDVERIDGLSFYYILEESFPRLTSSVGRHLYLEIWLQDPNQAASIKKELAPFNLNIETWKERNASLFFALKVEKIVVSLLVGLSTLIAGLSIISVMVLLLTLKRKDVGNLLAMGMTQKQTKKTFVTIGMFLTLSGVIAGVITGVLGSFMIDRFSQDVLPAFYEETNIPSEVQALQVLGIVFFGFLFSYFALEVTIRKLSSFRPSEILRG